MDRKSYRLSRGPTHFKTWQVYWLVLELCFALLLAQFGLVWTPIQRFLIFVPCRPPSRGVDNFRPQYQVAPDSSMIISTRALGLELFSSCTWLLSKSIVICSSVCDAISVRVSGIFTGNYILPHFLARSNSWAIPTHTNNSLRHPSLCPQIGSVGLCRVQR